MDGETFIEKYTRGVSAVETILTLDRLRQSVAVKELVNAKAKLQPNLISTGNGNSTSTTSQFMRKTVSVPNISHVSSVATSNIRLVELKRHLTIDPLNHLQNLPRSWAYANLPCSWAYAKLTCFRDL